MKRNLLVKQDYDKILKMSPEEIGKYLEDFEYKKEVEELGIEFSGVELVERVLQKNLGNKFEKLLKISPPDLRLLILLYLKRYDMENIKTVIRGKYNNLENDDIKTHLNTAAPSDESFFDKLLAQKTVEEVVNTLDFLDEKDVRAGLEHFKNDGGLIYIENALDKHYFAFVMSQLRYLTLEGKLYKKFLLNEMDVRNIKALLRLKQEGMNDQHIKDLIFAFGNIKREDIEKMIKMDEERILKELEKTDFKDVAEKHAKEEKINYLDLEVDLDHFLLEQSRKLIRQYPMSVDVILGYMFLKDLEVKNITRIIKAKQLHMTEEFIEKAVVI